MGTNILLTLLLLIPTAVYGKDYFTAAVFEHRHRHEPGSNKIETVSANLLYYEKAAEIASDKGADIIVFNEYGIVPYWKGRDFLKNFAEQIPNPEKVKVNPCEMKTEKFLILSSLSCLAKKNSIYVVANMVDIQPCEATCDTEDIKDCNTKCPEDGVLMYNTDVVFDREGNLIAKYHKVHLYFENLNVPEETEYVTFKTNFGTFGLIICFDSVFEESTILARDYGIDTLIFPTWWYDDIVPLNGVEFQQSWAIANKVNFIAANTHTPGTGSLGSGIYSKDYGALVYTYEPDGKSKLLVANVPLKKKDNFSSNPSVTVVNEDKIYEKHETGDLFPEQAYYKVAGPANDNYTDYRVFKHQMENYTIVKLIQDKGKNVEACNNEFCCFLNYEADSMKEDYFFVVHNGLNNVRGFFHWWEEGCFLLRCDPFDNKQCVMQPSRASTTFKSVEITAEFTTDKIYPTVSTNKFRLAPKTEWKLENHGSKTTLKFKTDEDEPLLKVGFLGRCYEKDPPYTPFYKH